MVSLRRVAAFVLALLLTAGVVSAQTPPDFAGSWTGAIAGGLHLGTFEVTQDNGAVTGVFRTSHSSQPRKVTGTVRPDGVLEAFFDGERSRPFEVRRVEGPALEVTMDGGRMIFRPTACRRRVRRRLSSPERSTGRPRRTTTDPRASRSTSRRAGR